MLPIGTQVVGTWSPSNVGVVVGYATLFMRGRPATDDNGVIDEYGPDVCYLVDIGRTRMFDLEREPPGFAGVRIIVMRADRVEVLGNEPRG